MATNPSTIASGGARDKRGVVRFAAPGADVEIPKTITEALAVSLDAYTPAGYVGEDGISEEAAKEPDPVKEMGGSTVAQLLPEYEHTFTFTLIEALNANTLRLLNGSENVTVTSEGVTVRSNDSLPEERAYLLDVLDKAGQRIRIAIPRGQATVSGETVYSAGEVIAYEVTLVTFPDEDGVNAYRHYINTGTTETITPGE